MDKSQKNISDFEHLLRKQNYRKPSFIYDKDLKSSAQPYKAQDVIKTVCSQVKAYQLADSVKGGKSGYKVKPEQKKSHFLTINKLPTYGPTMQTVTKVNPHNFDTQYELDTQVMNIMDGALATDSNTGFTQEFDNSFAHNNAEKNENPKLDENRLNVVNPNNKNNTTNTENINKNNNKQLEVNMDNKHKVDEQLPINYCDTESNKIKIINLNNGHNSYTSKTANDDTVTLNESLLITQNVNVVAMDISSENVDMLHSKTESIESDTGQDRLPSPVLNMKTAKRKLKSPSPLIVSLETFENFENMAMSLIEDCEFETAKHLINSQILGNELCINNNAEVLLGSKSYSPILEFKSDELQINSNDMKLHSETNSIITAQNFDITEQRSEVLKDEILFSSDEEDFGHFVDHNLPPTCILNMSDDLIDDLEETMYVGFQTASNKSIQISKDSFDQAQKILDNNNTKSVKELTLKELVEKCENIQSKPESATKAKELQVVESMSIFKDNSISNNGHNNIKASCEKPKINNLKISDKVGFKGFMTASNKKINMSDTALKRCQEVFQDIDLYQNFEDQLAEEVKCAKELKQSSIKTEIHSNTDVNNKTCPDNTINDEIIIDEFENIEMLIEEKENNMDRNVKTITDINQPSTSKAIFVGFKTANDKEIKISDEALEKSMNVFKDMGTDKHKTKTLEDILNQSSSSHIKYVGFRTANNKEIKISDEAMSKTKGIFQDVDKEKKYVDFPKKNNKSVSKVNKLSLNNDIEVLDEPYCNSKNTLEKSDESNILMHYGIKETLMGFKSASNKKIKTSVQAVKNSRKLFKDIMTDHDSINIIKEESVNSNTKLNTDINDIANAYAVANDKAVNISAETLENSKQIFSTLDQINSNTKNNIMTDVDREENHLFKGFQTASNKPVTISADALAKSKKIFDDIDKGSDPKNNNFAENGVNFMTFRTNEKPVEVNTDALKAGKKLHENFFDDDIKPQTNAFVGFKTASNKKVVISDEALKKCKNIFNDIENIETVPLPTNIESKPIFTGFQTANNKKVEISEEALIKTKNLFDDFNIGSIKEPITPFIDFQTANNKKVEISEEALEKSKNIFADINITENNSVKPFLGFQTANNKEVTISKEALIKGRQLFQNIDTDNKEKIPKNNFTIPTNKIDESNKIKHNFTFQTGTNKKITVSKDALIQSQKLLNNNFENDISDKKTELPKNFKDDLLNIENIIDTQVINDFHEDVCTEDFREIAKRNKRSGSPILLCPKAKKRKKFETPYSTKPKPVIITSKPTEMNKPVDVIKFSNDYKKHKRYTLKDLFHLENSENKNIDPYLLNFNLDNMLTFQFDRDRNDLQNEKMTMDDVKNVFTEAVEKKLIPDGWLDIQIKLILWKLISYEIRFPNTLGKVCMVKNLLDQLKYRYEKELYNAERPILRKILEKDDVPSKTMVLCVAGIYVDGVSVTSATTTNNIELLLTDGWYFVRATIDNMLSKLVYNGRIFVGCKIVTSGAELLNCEQGIAPWEDTSTVRLSISGNSTFPAPRHTALGPRRPRACPLSSVTMDGGRVAALRARVVRVYPALYVERLGDSTVTRSERLENQYQMKYESEREAMIEKICEEVEKEMSDQDSSQDSGDSQNKRKCFDSGSQIAKMMKISKDPMEFRAQLSPSQVRLLQSHASLQRDRLLQAIQDRVRDRLCARNVVALVRGRIIGFQDGAAVTRGMLSIWKPNDDVLDIFKEGSWIEVTNVVPTAMRNSEIQLSAGRQSVFKPIKCNEDKFKPQLKPFSRICYHLRDLSQNPAMTTEYNEVDTVGMIFAIEPTNREFESNKNQFQNAYLADIDKNIICVNFWGGMKKFGYENILDTGQVIYCSNLQKRAGNSRKNIPQFRATEFTIFTKTPKNGKGREMVEEINKKMLGLDRRKFCEDCVAVKQNYSAIRCLNDSENISPYRFNKSDYNLCKNRLFIDTPVGIKLNNRPEEFNLTGLDFESSFRQQDTQLSPKSLERKRKVSERISKLKRYGEPPPLTPINIINKSKNATSSYKSPLSRNGSEMSNRCIARVNKLQNNTTPIKLPNSEDIIAIEDLSERSPIISMNRTYVKKTINPVKLSFSENVVDRSETSVVDHFAEEFDASPPISLE